MMLEFFSSSNGVVNSKRAVAECLENALGTDNLDCDLIIFYTTMGHNFEELMSELHRLSPNAQVAGCSGMGVIAREGPNESMRALGIMAIRGPKEEFAVASMDSIIGMDPCEVGSRIAKDLKRQNPRINMIHFLPSVMDIAPVDEAIEGIESVFGADVPIFGGLSVDNMRFVSSFQFAGDRIIERGAVAIGFADPTLELIMQANHGLDIVGEPFEVTRSDSRCINEIDSKPAWKALTERLGVPETTPPRDVAALVPLGQKLPQEFHEEYGSPYILCSGAWKEDDGSIRTVRACPVGTKLWMTRRDEDKMLEELDRMIGQLIDRSGGRKPLAVFHADCFLRGRQSFHRILKEEIISRMQYPICKDKTVPWLGFYGAGEFAALGSRNMLHIFTTSLSVLYRRDDQG